MSLSSIKTAVMVFTNRSLFVLKVNAPTIMVVGGCIGVGVSTVLACRATLKASDILDQHNTNLDDIALASETHPEQYSKNDRTKDLVTVYTHTTFEFIKVYGPAVVIGVASLACIIGGHNILKGRNAALAAAYKALDLGFKKYRKNVVDELGPDKDREFKYGSHKEEITVKDPETNENKKIYGNVAAKASVYSRVFDQSNVAWCDNTIYMEEFFRGQAFMWNQQLTAENPIFLNEVYKSLRLSVTEPGCTVGWLPHSNGDNKVEIDFWPIHIPSSNGSGEWEFAYMLDFNVDGSIHNKL
jgi:hypothetical protein